MTLATSLPAVAQLMSPVECSTFVSGSVQVILKLPPNGAEEETAWLGTRSVARGVDGVSKVIVAPEPKTVAMIPENEVPDIRSSTLKVNLTWTV